MGSTTFRSGQALSSMPVASGSLVAGQTINTRNIFLATPQDPRSVRVQAIYWEKSTAVNGLGGIALYDGAGVQFYSGSIARNAGALTAIHATLPYLNITTPIYYRIHGTGNAGKRIILYGEIV